MKTLSLLCLVTTLLYADTRVTDEERDGVRTVVITLSEGSFTLEHLEELSRLELSRAPRAALISLTMIGSRGGVPLPKPDHFGFQTWMSIYNARNELNEIAEMTAIHEDAVLRVRERNGTATERILSGTNPLHISAGGQDFQILSVFESREDIRFFISTAFPLRVDGGEELLRTLQVALPNTAITANVQNDGLFIDSAEYPFLNPFVRIDRPPTEDEYRRIKTLTCNNTRTPRCEIH